jgi:hypothetical protein
MLKASEVDTKKTRQKARESLKITENKSQTLTEMLITIRLLSQRKRKNQKRKHFVEAIL